MIKYLIINLTLACALTAPPAAARPQAKGGQAAAESSRGNVEAITAEQLKDYLYFVASDEMEGRDTPSRGLDLTAKFIALNLSRWGVKPGGDNGTYFQRIALRRGRPDLDKSSVELNGQKLKPGEDFLAQPVAGSARGPLVYVGHGWLVKSKNVDALQGVDVKDKIAVIVSGGGLPKGVTFGDLSGGKQGEDWETPQGYLAKRGAKGIVVIPSTQYLSNWARERQALTDRAPLAVEKFRKGDAAEIPSVVLSEKAATALLQGEKVDGPTMIKSAGGNEPGAPFDLSPEKKLHLTVAAKVETPSTQNVIGVLEGADPALKGEYVAVGAHYDHVGNAPPGCQKAGGDEICNGADDDGSGTVALLAMAEAFAAGPRPKRSILFVWHAGEEKGLWGAKYFNEYPTVALKEVVAQLNIDMIGRSKQQGDTNPRNQELTGPNEIYVIGSKMMSTDLGELSEAVNKSYLNLSFNYKYDDPKDPNRFFFRSDHYHYARKGIPIIFYFDGVHEDYHKPGDHPDKIDYRKMEKVARTIFATAWELANRPARPRVDKQLPSELMGN